MHGPYHIPWHHGMAHSLVDNAPILDIFLARQLTTLHLDSIRFENKEKV